MPVLEALRALDVSGDLWTFLDDADLDSWIAGGVSRLRGAGRGVTALPEGLRSVSSCDLLVVQREALPLNSLLMEKRAAARGTPIIWDVDDRLWGSPSFIRNAFRGGDKKYLWLARHATEVWAGNEYAANWAADAGAAQVRWVPTTIPVPEAISRERQEDDLLVWIGSRSTGPFIERLLHDLHDRLDGWRVLVVGATVDAPPSVRLTQKPWSPEAEADALERGAVGLYPLDLAHRGVVGKSALKCVLYMAYGLPVIATPTASNEAVMTDGVEGLFASTPEQWLDCLTMLTSPARRDLLSAAGRLHAATNFDSGKWGRQLAGRIQAYL